VNDVAEKRLALDECSGKLQLVLEERSITVSNE